MKLNSVIPHKIFEKFSTSEKMRYTLTSSSCGFLPKEFKFFCFIFNLGLCPVPLCNDPSTWFRCNRMPSSIIKPSACSHAPVRWERLWWPQSPDLFAWLGVDPPPPPSLIKIQVLKPWYQVLLSNAALWSIQASSQSSISRPERFPSGTSTITGKSIKT